MITGRFGEIGELFFEIEVVAADGEKFVVETLLDTGFTPGWLAMDLQDIQSLGWSLIEDRYLMQTARGEELFRLYAGNVIVDGQEINIPVVATLEVLENLLGLQWLKTQRLVVDYPAAILTLGFS